ncbi:hypothetical protein ACP70R_031571 [Stipagrostis hirtigluma subsp. patula]
MDVTNTRDEQATKSQSHSESATKSQFSASRLADGATESGTAPDHGVNCENREASSSGLISHEEYSGEDGKARTDSADKKVGRDDTQDAQGQLQHARDARTIKLGGEAPSRSSGDFRLQPIDFTKRSEFLAVNKQLAQYFKKSLTMNWPLFLALLSSTFCVEKRHRTWIFCASSAFSLTLNVVPSFLAGWMAEKEPSTGNEVVDDEKVDPSDRYRIFGLCIAAYLSNFSWTGTAVSFAMLVGAGYSWFFLILAVLMVPYYFIIKYGIENGITWGVVQYAEHRSDMDFFFGLCFEITQTNFTALAATVYGYLQRSQCRDVSFRAPEMILLFAVVIGLFVMTICTVPPAAGLPSYRDAFVRRILKITVYWLIVLTCVGLFLAVWKVCGRYVLLCCTVLVIDAVAYWQELLQTTIISHIVKVVTRCAEQKGISRDGEHRARSTRSPSGSTGKISLEASASRAEHGQQYSPPAPRAAREQSHLLISFFSIVSGALMVSYSLEIRVSWGYKVSLVLMYSAFVAYLGMVVIMREAGKDRTSAVWVSTSLAGFFLLGALACVIAFILSNPLHSRSFFT